MIALAQELATYNRLLPDLLHQIGKFALIKGNDLAGTHDSYIDALTAGYQLFKLEAFLVKLIALGEVKTFSRDLFPTPPAATIDLRALGMRRSP